MHSKGEIASVPASSSTMNAMTSSGLLSQPKIRQFYHAQTRTVLRMQQLSARKQRSPRNEERSRFQMMLVSRLLYVPFSMW